MSVRDRAMRIDTVWLMKKAYVASPLGFSEATAGFYNEIVLRQVREARIEPLDPWGDPSGATADEFRAAFALPPGDERISALSKINARLGGANAAMIRDADGLFAILDGVDVDSGTAAEVGYAAALHKPVVGLRLDTRLTGDNEAAVVNLQVLHFIRQGGGDVYRDLGEAVSELASLLG